jgi:hypothetical protein
MRLLILLLFMLFAVPALCGQDGEQTEDSGLLKWHLGSLDQPCGGDCRVMVFGGRFVDTAMEDIFFNPEPIWDWRWRDSQFLGLALSRRVVTVADVLDVEAEAGAGKRFGELTEAEVWAALYLRWTAFPWNHVVKTTVAISTGLNMASGISPVEVRRGEVDRGERVLHYFSPELTFAHPRKDDMELVFRIHHRSGGYGVISDVTGGAQYGTLGLRYHF